VVLALNQLNAQTNFKAKAQRFKDAKVKTDFWFQKSGSPFTDVSLTFVVTSDPLNKAETFASLLLSAFALNFRPKGYG